MYLTSRRRSSSCSNFDSLVGEIVKDGDDDDNDVILSLVCDVVDTLQPGDCLVASLAGLGEPDILLTFTIAKK